jgi:hypothetical protein
MLSVAALPYSEHEFDVYFMLLRFILALLSKPFPIRALMSDGYAEHYELQGFHPRYIRLLWILTFLSVNPLFLVDSAVCDKARRILH